MPRCFIGYWTNDLTDAKKDFIPLGVIVRDEEFVSVRVIDQDFIPDDYKPKSEIGRGIFRDLEDIFMKTRAL